MSAGRSVSGTCERSKTSQATLERIVPSLVDVPQIPGAIHLGHHPDIFSRSISPGTAISVSDRTAKLSLISPFMSHHIPGRLSPHTNLR